MNWLTKLLKRRTIQIEGTYEKSYSLSIVNTSLALALKKYSWSKVKIDPTKYHKEYMLQHKNVDKKILKLSQKTLKNIDITIRNIYPPHTDEMNSKIRIFGPYGWEESKIPAEYVNSFNQDLTHVFAMSNYVKRLLINNGVKVPIYTTGIIVDDLRKIKSKPFEFELPTGYKLLHISSAFARKGVDLLLESFEQLESIENPSLILKTFPNPHNNIEELLEKLDFQKTTIYEEGVALYRKNSKSILFINKNIEIENIKYLYENSDLLVVPTKGEGFGLPMAEAMVMDLPVVTTKYGGQSDFCTDETSWLCDFSFEYSSTHLGVKDSIWQVPYVDSIKEQIIKVYNSSQDEINQKTLKAKQLILENYSQKKIAHNIIEIIEQEPKKKDINIALFSTYNVKCGIALYAKSLISGFKENVTVFANTINNTDEIKDDANTHRCWDERAFGNNIELLKEKLIEFNIKQFIIQYNFGFLSLEKLEELILFCEDHNIQTHLFLHSTKDVIMPTYIDSFSTIADSLEKVDQIYMHTIEDMNYLKDFGIYKNLSLFTHGIDSTLVKQKTKPKEDIPTLATFGFLLPQKGIFELVDITELLHKRGLKVKLVLLNSIHPAPISKELQGKLLQRVDNSPIKEFIYVNNDFLDEEKILDYLTNSDKIIYPYRTTQESSSAAVRLGILSLNEVITTPSPIFDDVKEVITQSKDDSIESIADTIEVALRDDFDNSKQQKWIEQNSWNNISNNLYNIIKAQ